MITAIPLLWRYLLKQYLKVLALALSTFIAVLFVTRLQQIALFATMGATWWQIALFALHLIPYMLPIALPISCLIGAVILYQRLSHAQELTAMRASGMGFKLITGPILLAGVALSLFNFYVASELATHAHLLGKRMQQQQSVINPLNLLQNTQLLKHNDVFVEMRSSSGGEIAEGVTIIMPNKEQERLGMLRAKKLVFSDDKLHGTHVDLITSANETLMMEHQAEMWTPSEGFNHLIKQMTWQPKNNQLRLRLLLAKIDQEKGRLSSEDLTPKEALVLQRGVSKGYSELFRRVSIAIAAFTFTLMGCAFGVEISRHPSRKGVIMGVALTAFFVICFLAAGEFSEKLTLSTLLYFLPHTLLIPLSIWKLRHTTKGYE